MTLINYIILHILITSVIGHFSQDEVLKPMQNFHILLCSKVGKWIAESNLGKVESSKELNHLQTLIKKKVLYSFII
jgi:predicted LPLAT superfamily acyltransferase